jgi:ABC-type multidrug transport system permease subunit
VFVSFYVFASSSAPAFLRNIAEALPLKPLIDGLSAAIVSGSDLGGNLDALAIVALWGAFGCYFAVRGFDWESRS